MKKPGLLKVIIFIALFNICQIGLVSFLDPKNAVEKRIKGNIKDWGLQSTAIYYMAQTPFWEERDYRLWALLFVFIFRKVSVRNPFFWLVVIIPNFNWAFGHTYPLLYQYLIFIGGLFNGGLILYFYQDDRWQGRLKTILAPIIAHAEINFMIVGTVMLKNGLI